MRHIYLCKCIFRIFIAWTYSSHPWLWPAYVKSRFVFIRTVELKGLCLQLKRSGTKYAAQKINFLTSAVANGSLFPLWKVSLGANEVLMSYYLFIFLSLQHVQHMTSQILLILIDFDRVFDHFLIWNSLSLNRYNSGTRRYIKHAPRACPQTPINGLGLTVELNLDVEKSGNFILAAVTLGVLLLFLYKTTASWPCSVCLQLSFLI